MKENKKLKIQEIIYNHIRLNSKEYTIIFLIFIIGIFLGVMFINNIKEEKLMQITSYLNEFIEKLKITENIDKLEILKTSIGQKIILVLTIWFFGTTAIGIPIVFGIVLYRGFCLGYTISTIAISLGTGKGLIFILISLLLQNLIFIPALIGISVSGFKLYKSIIKDRNKENIKIEIVRHTLFSIIMLIIMCISSIIEVWVSTSLLKVLIKYF